MIYLFFALLLAALVFFLLKFLHFKIFFPSVIISIMFSFSSLCAFIGRSSWNQDTNINSLTFIIPLIGLISIIFGEYSINFFLNKKHAQKNAPLKDKSSLTAIRLHWLVYALVLAFYAVVIYLIIRNLNHICDTNAACTATSLTGKINFYRSLTPLFSADPTSFDFFTRQLIKLSPIISAICAYIFVNNCLTTQKPLRARILSNLHYLVPTILAVVVSLLQSSRGSATVPIAAFVAIYAILLFRYKPARKATIRLIKQGLAALLIILPIFYFALPLIGRDTKFDFVQYTSFYFGAPLPTLNRFLNSEISAPTNEYPGQTTFRGIYNFTDKLSLTDEHRAESLTFTSFNGMRSNIYTGFYRFYVDFGIVGVIILSCLVGLGYGLLAYLAFNKRRVIFLIFFAINFAIILDFVRDETFFQYFIASSTVVQLLFLIILNELLLPPSEHLIWGKNVKRKN